jgi:hypothetical protein
MTYFRNHGNAREMAETASDSCLEGRNVNDLRQDRQGRHGDENPWLCTNGAVVLRGCLFGQLFDIQFVTIVEAIVCIVRSFLESGRERFWPHLPPPAHPSGLARAVGGRKMLGGRGSDGKGSCDLWASSHA